MNNNQTIEKLKQMRLSAMAELHAAHLKDNRTDKSTPDEYLALLTDHQWEDRQNKQDPTVTETGGVQTTGQPRGHRSYPEQKPEQEHVRAFGYTRFYSPKGEHHHYRGFRGGKKLLGAGIGEPSLYDAIQNDIRQYRQTP